MTNDKRDALKTQLMQHAGEFIDAVIDGLAAAGSQGEWDSETVEYVVAPMQTLLEEWKIPIVGEPGLEDENTKYWCEVGGYDYEGEYPDEDESDRMWKIESEFVHMNDATVSRAKYGGGALALVAESYDDDGMMERETLSVNLIAYGMDPGEGNVYVRDDAEHKGLPAALVEAGIATYLGGDPENARVFFGPFDSSAYVMKVSEEIE